jgi:ABC-type tungstate transport system permease subunit
MSQGIKTETKHGTPTSVKVAAALTDLRLALEEKYGCDFSFVVLGQGNMLAASNNVDGDIRPVTNENR